MKKTSPYQRLLGLVASMIGLFISLMILILISSFHNAPVQLLALIFLLFFVFLCVYFYRALECDLASVERKFQTEKELASKT